MMPPVYAVLFGAFITIAACLSAGRLIVRDRLLALPVGASIVSTLVFVLVSCGWAYPAVLLAFGAALIVLGVRRGWAGEEALPGYDRFWKALFWVAFALVGAVCLLHALAPEVSPAGTRIYLADVMRRVPTQAASVEMLFLFAFAFGKHSAAALVSYAFLLTLALLMLAYGRRAGLAKAGVFAAVFTLASPVVMVDGSSACPDVALACALFAMFGLLEKWDVERSPGDAVPIGLLAGFACGAGPAGWFAPLYALGFIAWRGRRSARRALAVAALCALAAAAPALWALRAETQNLKSPALAEILNAPEAALHSAILGGAVEGLTGPLFLLAPIALFAWRTALGRRALVAAALFSLPYAARLETRFLIPALPFVSLAMGLALANTRVLMPLLAIAQVILAWPPLTARYSDPSAWRIRSVSVGPALHQRAKEKYLARYLPGYTLARALDEQARPAPGKVLAIVPFPRSHTIREVTFSERLAQVLRAAVVPELRPTRRLRFFVPRREVRALRVSAPAPWSVHELRLFDGGREIARSPQWRLRARPDTQDVQVAFDNNPVTLWTGERLEAAFGSPVTFDSMVLESPPAQSGVDLEMEILDESGVWQLNPDLPERTDVLRPAGLRSLATRELRARGIGYLAADESTPLGRDLFEKRRLWGIEEIAGEGSLRVYRLLTRSYR